MNKLISTISITVIQMTVLGAITTGAALAHPGHGVLEQTHGFLHAEHLLILAAIACAILIKLIIKKRL